MSNELHSKVRQALLNAIENSYEEFVLKAPASAVAVDLERFDSELEGRELSEIERAVEAVRSEFKMRSNSVLV